MDSVLERLAWTRACQVPVRIGINGCRPGRGPAFPVHLVTSEKNLGKPGMMRQLLRKPLISTEWTIWFDDDSFPYRADWLRCLEVAIEVQPAAVMLGVPATTHVCGRTVEFITEAPWYRNIPLLPSEQPGMAAKLRFILGGFWAIRTEWLYRLDWPDRRIVHFEDDYMLGEAIRQNGGEIGQFRSGVKIDTLPRRAPPGMPSSLESWRPGMAEHAEVIPPFPAEPS